MDKQEQPVEIEILKKDQRVSFDNGTQKGTGSIYGNFMTPEKELCYRVIPDDKSLLSADSDLTLMYHYQVKAIEKAIKTVTTEELISSIDWEDYNKKLLGNKKDLLSKALEFANSAHHAVKQTRKYTEEPYIVHPLSVIKILIEHGITDMEVLVAAALHDTVEDTHVKSIEILKVFGKRVAVLVDELTDKYTKEAYPNLNRRERKVLETDRISTISIEAKEVKMADLIDNSRSISEHDKDFAVTYLKEKKKILGVIKTNNLKLYNSTYKAYTEAMDKINITNKD